MKRKNELVSMSCALAVSLTICAFIFGSCNEKKLPANAEVSQQVSNSRAAAPIVATSLDNIVVGGAYGYMTGIRFQSSYNGPLASIRIYEIVPGFPATQHAGYSAGTGGKLNYQLCEDEATGTDPARIPQPSWLCVQGAAILDSNYSEPQNFPLVYFPGEPLIASGDWYLLTVSNSDPSPATNYSSVDYLWNPNLSNQTPTMQVIEYDKDTAHWYTQPHFIPVVQFTMANGQVFGQGYVAASPSLDCGTEYGFALNLCP